MLSNTLPAEIREQIDRAAKLAFRKGFELGKASTPPPPTAQFADMAQVIDVAMGKAIELVKASGRFKDDAEGHHHSESDGRFVSGGGSASAKNAKREYKKQVNKLRENTSQSVRKAFNSASHTHPGLYTQPLHELNDHFNFDAPGEGLDTAKNAIEGLKQHHETPVGIYNPEAPEAKQAIQHIEDYLKAHADITQRHQSGALAKEAQQKADDKSRRESFRKEREKKAGEHKKLVAGLNKQKAKSIDARDTAIDKIKGEAEKRVNKVRSAVEEARSDWEVAKENRASALGDARDYHQEIKDDHNENIEELNSDWEAKTDHVLDNDEHSHFEKGGQSEAAKDLIVGYSRAGDYSLKATESMLDQLKQHADKPGVKPLIKATESFIKSKSKAIEQYKAKKAKYQKMKEKAIGEYEKEKNSIRESVQKAKADHKAWFEDAKNRIKAAKGAHRQFMEGARGQIDKSIDDYNSLLNEGSGTAKPTAQFSDCGTQNYGGMGVKPDEPDADEDRIRVVELVKPKSDAGLTPKNPSDIINADHIESEEPENDDESDDTDSDDHDADRIHALLIVADELKGKVDPVTLAKILGELADDPEGYDVISTGRAEHLSPSMDFADWTYEEGPRGGKRWKNNETGRYVYGAEKPGGKREAATKTREEAHKAANTIIRDHIHGKATPDQLRDLINHIPHLNHAQLSSVRARLMASFGGKRGLQDRIEALKKHIEDMNEPDALDFSQEAMDHGKTGPTKRNSDPEKKKEPPVAEAEARNRWDKGQRTEDEAKGKEDPRSLARPEQLEQAKQEDWKQQEDKRKGDTLEQPPVKKEKKKKPTMFETERSLADIVRRSGGIRPDSHTFKAHFGSMKEAMEFLAPHEMSREDYIKQQQPKIEAEVKKIQQDYLQDRQRLSLQRQAGFEHQDAVKAAVEKGQPVHESAAKDYPNIKPVKKIEPQEHEKPLYEFAKTVQQLADTSPYEERFGDKKAFISDIYKRSQTSGALPKMTLDQFKQQLLDANNKSFLNLATQDDPNIVPRDKHDESQIEYLGNPFHHVLTSDAGKYNDKEHHKSRETQEKAWGLGLGEKGYYNNNQ